MVLNCTGGKRGKVTDSWYWIKLNDTIIDSGIKIYRQKGSWQRDQEQSSELFTLDDERTCMTFRRVNQQSGVTNFSMNASLISAVRFCFCFCFSYFSLSLSKLQCNLIKMALNIQLFAWVNKIFFFLSV